MDSGSDFVLIPKEIADALQIDYDKGLELVSRTFDGQEFRTKTGDVRMEIIKGREKIQLTCKAAISLTGPDYKDIIIGSSFFEHFKIIFDYPHNKFQIKSTSRKF